MENVDPNFWKKLKSNKKDFLKYLQSPNFNEGSALCILQMFMATKISQVSAWQSATLLPISC